MSENDLVYSDQLDMSGIVRKVSDQKIFVENLKPDKGSNWYYKKRFEVFLSMEGEFN